MGRHRQTHCKRGHEIAVVGRYGRGACRACMLGREDLPAYKPMKPPATGHCAYGHALTPDNVYRWRGRVRGCLLCRKRNSERYRNKSRVGRQFARVVPPDPIWAFVERIGIKEFAANAGQALGIQPTSVERLLYAGRTNGFTIDTADDICVALGRHPAEIFGPEWFTYGAKEVASAV